MGKKKTDVNAEGVEVAEGSNVSSEISSITFTLRSGATRVFSEATHGEDFETIADEFEKNNTKNTTEGQVAHTTGERSRVDFIVSKS